MRRIIALLFGNVLVLMGIGGCAKVSNNRESSLTKTSETITAPMTMFFLADESVRSLVNIQGRYSVLPSQGVTLDWTGSALEFTAECSGDVVLELMVQTQIRSKDTDRTSVYFSVYMDGQRMPRQEVKTPPIGQTGTVELVLAQGLSRGTHTFSLIRETEAVSAFVTARTIGLYGNIQKTKARPQLIEFVGDSITAGLCNVYRALHGTDSEKSSYAVYQDGTQTYAWMTAQRLNADYSILATSGISVYYGYNSTYSGTWLEYYPYVNPYRDRTERWESTRSADLVCINLGTNDVWGGMTFTDDELAARMAELMKNIRNQHPDAGIVWIVGGIIDSYQSAAELAVDSLGGEDNQYYLCVVSSGLMGCGHPSAEEHERMADELTAFITAKNLLK